jgi:hypothetical protein
VISKIDKDSFFSGHSLSTGHVRKQNVFFLIGTNNELTSQKEPNSRIFTYINGKVGARDIPWLASSGAVCTQPEERFITVGEEGFIWSIGGGESREEAAIDDNGESPEFRGLMREVRTIPSGFSYAVGTCRQAYKREQPDKWVCIDQTAQTPVADITETSFESIDGFSQQEIYTVGWNGEIWQYDGSRFAQIDSPTNLALYKVRCGTDGYVYACGQLGILLRGRDNKWEIINHESTKEDLWGMEYFNGKLYISSTHFVYTLENEKLKLVDFGDDIPGTCYHLSAADGIMWSIGAKDIMEFNGETWKRILEID